MRITLFSILLLILSSCQEHKGNEKEESETSQEISPNYELDTSYYPRRDTVIVMDTAKINGYLYSLVNDHGRATLTVQPGNKVITGEILFTPPSRFLRRDGKVSHISFNEVGVSSTFFIMGYAATNEDRRTIQAVNTKIDSVFITKRYAEYYKKDIDPNNFLYEQKDFLLYGYEGSHREIETY